MTSPSASSPRFRYDRSGDYRAPLGRVKQSQSPSALAARSPIRQDHTNFGASKNREKAMKAFLDDKKFKPGVEHFKDTT